LNVLINKTIASDTSDRFDEYRVIVFFKDFGDVEKLAMVYNVQSGLNSMINVSLSYYF